MKFEEPVLVRETRFFKGHRGHGHGHHGNRREVEKVEEPKKFEEQMKIEESLKPVLEKVEEPEKDLPSLSRKARQDIIAINCNREQGLQRSSTIIVIC